MLDNDEDIRKEIEAQGLDGSMEINMNWAIQEHAADLGFIMEILRDVIPKIEGYNPDGFVNAAIGTGVITFSWNFVMPAQTVVVEDASEVILVEETVGTELGSAVPYWDDLKAKMDSQGTEGSVYVNRDWFNLDENNSHALTMHLHSIRDRLGLIDVETSLEYNMEDGTILLRWRIW